MTAEESGYHPKECLEGIVVLERPSQISEKDKAAIGGGIVASLYAINESRHIDINKILLSSKCPFVSLIRETFAGYKESGIEVQGEVGLHDLSKFLCHYGANRIAV